MKRRAKTFAEMDTASRFWRKRLCYLNRPGVTARIKRQMRRRERRAAKTEIWQQWTGDG